MNDDLSDEAAKDLCREYWKTPTEKPVWLRMWQEAKRRAEAIIEERERKAFEAGFDLYDRMCVTTRAERLQTAYRAYRAEGSK
jgi:hypothetical protein